MKWEFYEGAYLTRVHIMEDDGSTIMMSAHVFEDEERANAFAELWQMSTTEEQRHFLWQIGNGARRDTDPREIAMQKRMAAVDPVEQAARDRDFKYRYGRGRWD